MVAMQHNQRCMTSGSVCVSADETLPWQSCYTLPPHWMSLLNQLSVWNCNADLHFPSPSLFARSAQVCTIMCAEAEACMCEWGCPLLHLLPISIAGILCSASLCRGLVTAAGAVTAIAASASFPHPSLQHPLHPRKHRFLTSSPAPPICTHPLSLISLSPSIGQSHPGLIYPASSPSSLLLGRACHCNSPPLPSSSPPSALWSTVQEKAGKLSLLPVKVSVGWAAGLPLSLWRMILWMKTEEMALGELLERLRTVTQSIGGWQQHTQHQLQSLVIVFLIAEDYACLSATWI